MSMVQEDYDAVDAMIPSTEYIFGEWFMLFSLSDLLDPSLIELASHDKVDTRIQPISTALDATAVH